MNFWKLLERENISLSIEQGALAPSGWRYTFIKHDGTRPVCHAEYKINAAFGQAQPPFPFVLECITGTIGQYLGCDGDFEQWEHGYDAAWLAKRRFELDRQIVESFQEVFGDSFDEFMKLAAEESERCD